MYKKKEHPYLFIGREDNFQSGPAIDPVTFTLADTMRRKISGGNKWDQQLEGYLQRWVGLIPAPLVRRASAEAKKQLTWQLQEEARKKKEREAATALLTTRIPVAPPLSHSPATSSTFVQQDAAIDAGGHHRIPSQDSIHCWAPAVPFRFRRCPWTSTPCCWTIHPTVASRVQDSDLHTLVSE